VSKSSSRMSPIRLFPFLGCSSFSWAVPLLFGNFPVVDSGRWSYCRFFTHLVPPLHGPSPTLLLCYLVRINRALIFQISSFPCGGRTAFRPFLDEPSGLAAPELDPRRPWFFLLFSLTPGANCLSLHRQFVYFEEIAYLPSRWEYGSLIAFSLFPRLRHSFRTIFVRVPLQTFPRFSELHRYSRHAVP